MATDEILDGALCILSETGYEKCPWAIRLDGTKGPDGVRILRPGDKLTIYNQDNTVIFEDVLLIGKERVGFFGNWYPKGISRRRWDSWFTKNYRARIVRGVPDDIARMVARVMTWEGYLLHIESFSNPAQNQKGCITVVVACYFPDSKRKSVRLEISFEDGIVRDIRPL